MTKLDDKFEATLRYSTGEYEYAEVKVFDAPEGILEAWGRFKGLFEAKRGLAEPQFNVFVDNMLLNNAENHIEDMEQLNDKQLYTMQVIKRALKRIEARQSKQ